MLQGNRRAGGYLNSGSVMARPKPVPTCAISAKISNDAAISASGARVQVYRGDSAVQSFSVPSGTGRWWNVFTMDGATGTITAVNRITAAGH